MLLASCMAGWRFPVRGLGYATRWRISRGRAAYSARSGERHVAANGDGIYRMVCRERFSQIGRALRTKKPTIVTLLTR